MAEKGGYVYLLCDANSELFKIGVTRGSIEKRMKKLQTGNGNEIHIVKYYKSDIPFRIEKILHKKFCQQNVLNEWFMMDIDSIKSFESICEHYEKLLMDFDKKQKNGEVL